MRSEKHDEHLDLLRRCLEGTASTADFDRADATLDAAPELASELRLELGFEALLRTALRADDPADFARRMGSRIRDRGNSRQFARAMRRRVGSAKRSRHPALRWPALAAALVLVSLLGLWLVDQGRQTEAAITISAISGEVVCHREGSVLPLVDENTLAIGDLIVAGPQSAARIRFHDGVDLALDGAGRLLLAAPSRLELQAGRARFAVPARPNGSPLRVDTPQARITVLGTRFAVAVDRRSDITVEHGRVRLMDRENWSLRVLEAGSSATSPAAAQPLFSEGWEHDLGNWYLADETLQPSHDDATALGFTVQDETLLMPAGATPHLLTPLDWPVETGRHLITTRFRYEASAQRTHHRLPLAILLKGPSQRLPEQQMPKPSISAGRWYRLAVTIDPRRRSDGGWVIHCHIALAPADDPTAEPFVITKSLWRLDEAASTNALFFMLRGDLAALRIAPLQVLRLDDDPL